MLDPPNIEFTRNGATHLAYQVAGAGPPDIVFVGGSFASSIEWGETAPARGFRRLASFSRLVTYDQKGMGFSDPIDPSAVPTLTDLEADLEAVIGAAGVEKPVLLGMHNGGAVAALYATRHPVTKLIVCNTWARLEHADDYPIGFRGPVLDELDERYQEQWGEGKISNFWAIPRADSENRQRELHSTSRNQAITLFRMNRDYDIRALLGKISVPTLVLHTADNRMVPPVLGNYIAESIPGAQFELVPGGDQNFLRNNPDPVIDLVEQFVTGTRKDFTDRTMMVMLFTDIVDSTPTAAALGDERWGALIDEHNERLRDHMRNCGGHEVKCTGDGFLIAFDTIEDAVRCALEAMKSMAGLGLELRAGVHVGEVSRMGKSDLSGLAVHFAQRLCARADGGQVLASGAVRDAGAGSDLRFVERGTAELKGIPGSWEIFEARL